MKKSNASLAAETEADDVPKLTAEWLAEADAYVGRKLVQRGRPKAERVRQRP